MASRGLLSILVPVFNEAPTVADCLRQVLDAPLPAGVEPEVIVVDDGSTDGTLDALHACAEGDPRIRVLAHAQNQGKGAAVRTALAASRGDICLIQDADLEYDPADYPRLLGPILDDEADVVYGSRFLPRERRRVLRYWHSAGNRFLTRLSNRLTDLDLTDMETGFKVARGDLFRSIPIRSARFGLEPELTAKFARLRCRICEVPVRYVSRGYGDGKKITWRDGVSALFTMLRFRFVRDLPPAPRTEAPPRNSGESPP